MPDFSWLNEIPEKDWDTVGLGHGLTFGNVQFYERCRVRSDDLVIEKFEGWAGSQPRHYEIQQLPSTKLRVTWGDWTTSAN